MKTSPLSLFHHAKPGQLTLPDDFSITWQSPSNIAIIKYWGKKNGQFPLNPSLSMTLSRAVTQTRVNIISNKTGKGLLSINGDPYHPFLPKMRSLIQQLNTEIPLLAGMAFSADTVNHFPHSTGIASSASGLSAFPLCILAIAGKMINRELTIFEIQHMASYASRLGSGSACRSLYGGYTAWGKSSLLDGSSDEFALPLSECVHPDMLQMRDAILVVSSNPKSLPSTQGHISMNGHPFKGGRIKQANQHFAEALHALSTNDFEHLGMIAECEALTLHALLMSANQGTLLMQQATVEIIHRVREARKTGLPLFFTLDAGANVHLLYPRDPTLKVDKFINDALRPLCEEQRVIFDSCGTGPVHLDELNLIFTDEQNDHRFV
jgi:diphosphomevalonate decarboxylase